MAQKKSRPIRTRNGIPLTRDEYRQLKRQKEREDRRKRQEAWEAARGPLDMPFLLLAMMLLGIGLIMLLSASFPNAQASANLGNDPLYFIKRQAVFAALGVGLMLWVSKINYERFRGLARLGLWMSLILLFLVIIPGPKANGRLLAISANGAARWLGIPNTSLTFQPSDLAKLGLIAFFAESISKKREKMRDFKEGFLYHIGILLVMVVMTALEPHFSGAILIAGIGAAMLVVGGIHWGWIAAGVSAVGLGTYLLAFTDVIENFFKAINYNASRIAVEGPLRRRPGIPAGRGLADHSGAVRHRLRRTAGGGSGQEPPEVRLPPRGPERLHLRRGPGGAGTGGRHPHHGAVLPAHHPGLLAGHPRKGPVREPADCGRHHPDRPPDLPEHRGGDQPHPLHRHFPPLLQLRGHGAGHSAGGGGRRSVGLTADSRAKGAVEKRLHL